MRKPTSDLVTYAALWDNLWQDDYVEGHQAMAQFIREQVPLPGALLRQIVDKLIRGNELAAGEHRARRPARPRSPTWRARCWSSWPSATSSCPSSPAQALREFMGPNMEELLLPAGHVGLITGPQGGDRDDPAHPRLDRRPQRDPARERADP